MQRFGMNEIPYGIPIYGVYGRKNLWNSDENRSKYFDLQKDVQICLDLGDIDKLEQEYIQGIGNIFSSRK